MNESSTTLLNDAAEMERLITASREALSDQMVERLSSTMGDGLELLNRLSEEDTRDALHAVIDELTALHRSGGLKVLMEVISLVVAARNAMTDSMVERLAEYAENMVNGLASESMNELATCAHDAVHEAIVETEKSPPSGGLFSLMAMMLNPETQKNLRFLMATAEKLRHSQL